MINQGVFDKVKDQLIQLGCDVVHCYHDTHADNILAVGDGAARGRNGLVWLFTKTNQDWVLKQTIEPPSSVENIYGFGEKALLTLDGRRLTIFSCEDEFEYDLDETGQFVKRN